MLVKPLKSFTHSSSVFFLYNWTNFIHECSNWGLTYCVYLISCKSNGHIMVIHGGGLKNSALSSVSMKRGMKCYREEPPGKRKNRNLHIYNKTWDSGYLAYWIYWGPCLILPCMTLYIPSLMGFSSEVLTPLSNHHHECTCTDWVHIFMIHVTYCDIGFVKAVDRNYSMLSTISYLQEEPVNSGFLRQVGFISNSFL